MQWRRCKWPWRRRARASNPPAIRTSRPSGLRRDLQEHPDGSHSRDSDSGRLRKLSGESEHDLGEHTNVGIRLLHGSNETTISRNELTENRLGIELWGVTGTVLSTNTVLESDNDGVFVASNATGTIISKNTASYNGDDGFDFNTWMATVSKNQAHYNGDLGIEAVPGVTDGGGNEANHNCNPLEWEALSGPVIAKTAISRMIPSSCVSPGLAWRLSSPKSSSMPTSVTCMYQRFDPKLLQPCTGVALLGHLSAA